MKKIKKILAAVMTLAMVLGMSMTTFAAPQEVTNISSTVTLTGLSSDVSTDVKVYQFARLFMIQKIILIAGRSQSGLMN